MPSSHPYPDSLQKEIDGYLGKLAHVDIFDEDGPDKPLKPMSLRNTEAHLRQFLDGLVTAGLSPESMISLEGVVSAEKMKIAFRAIRARSGRNGKPVGLYNISATLLALARHHLQASPDALEAIRKIKRKMAPTVSGMSEKNRERLRQFNGRQNVIALMALPQHLIERAKENPEAHRAALLAMHAAALAILHACPVRVKNLAGLDLERNVVPHRNGTRTVYTIRISGEEVKNSVNIEFRLNHRLSKVLHCYITQFRHMISPVHGTSVFPKRSDGKPRNPSNFGRELKDRIKRETGLEVHPHLFRHFAAKMYLRANPGAFETARQMLGHRKLQTTMDFYAEFSNQWSHEHYDETVLSKWGGSDD